MRIKRRYPMLIVLCAGVVCAQTSTRVGGATLNGNFNLPGTTGTISYAAEPYWVNIGGNQTDTFLNDQSGDALDGTHYVQLSERWGETAGLDTGHTILEGDTFDISYQWRDGWQWDDGTDQIRVRLFVTHNNTITGTQTTRASVLSGISTTNGSYELVDRDEIYVAAVADVGKKLFIAIEVQGGATLDSYGQLDNFELMVTQSASGSLQLSVSVPADGTIEVSFDAVSNHVYTLETSTNLLAETWTSRTSVGPLPTNSLQGLSYTNTSNPNALFGRVNYYYELYTAPVTNSAQYVPAGYASTPIFEDQFDGALDTSIWSRALREPISGDYVPGQFAGINEYVLNDKYHCSFEPDDSYTQNGSLNLRGQDRRVRGKIGGKWYDYTAGWVMSMHNFSFNKGYLEFRARFPSGDKVWPAVWLIAEDLIWGPEWDIFEYFGYREDRGYDVMLMNLYSTEYPAVEWDGDQIQPFDGTYDCETWHVYGFEWTDTYARFFIDGLQVGQINASEVTTGTWPDEEMYIVLNNGARRSSPDSTTTWPNTLEIDYIEVYQ